MIRGALASRYGISPLGRGVIRPASGGWWLSGGIAADKCAVVYQPKGAASAAASKTNLVSAGTHDAVYSGAVGWNAADGWVIDGDSKYVKVGTITGASHFSTSDSFCAFIRFTPTANSAVMGIQSPLVGAVWRSDPRILHYCVGAYTPYAGYASPSTICLNGTEIYIDGALVGTDTDTWSSSTSTKGFYLGFFEGYFWGREKIQAFSLYTQKLTSTQIGALHTAAIAL